MHNYKKFLPQSHQENDAHICRGIHKRRAEFLRGDKAQHKDLELHRNPSLQTRYLNPLRSEWFSLLFKRCGRGF